MSSLMPTYVRQPIPFVRGHGHTFSTQPVRTWTLPPYHQPRHERASRYAHSHQQFIWH